MPVRETAAIVLAAGKGTRMKSALPKVLHPLAGQPMINTLLKEITPIERRLTVVVVGPGMAAVEAAVVPHPVVVQKERRGTGHAVMCAREALGEFTGDVLVLFGDTPLITAATVDALLTARRMTPQPAVVVLGMRLADPGAYGRLVLDADGALEAIVEASDASTEERAITLCNSGVMCIDGEKLFPLLDQIGDSNAKNEFYLTDIVAVARRQGLFCRVVEADPWETLGINSRADLARAEGVVQSRLRQAAMDNGATLIDPASVYFSFDTVVESDVVIGPSVVFGPGVHVKNDARIHPFSHLEGAVVESGASIGPFARLRPGARIGDKAKIGNFVEVKNAVLAPGVRANHLSYLGDVEIGEGANIGAGTITCNYDGFDKAATVIGAGAFIGSNTSLVAPVTVGKGAIVGAGSVITKNVADDALAVARGEQREKPGAAARFRARKAKKDGKA